MTGGPNHPPGPGGPNDHHNGPGDHPECPPGTQCGPMTGGPNHPPGMPGGPGPMTGGNQP